MLTQKPKSLHLNNSSKPVIFLGCNTNLYQFTEECEDHGITVAGIMDSDYYGNTDIYCDVPVIGSETEFQDLERLEYYRKNFNFFCATNWNPINDPVTIRNKEKRHRLIDLIDKHDLPCITLIAKSAVVAPSVIVGKGSYIGPMVLIESKAVIGDFVTINSQSWVGHQSMVGRNSVLQRVCGFSAESTMEEDVFLSSLVRVTKPGIRLCKGTFITENIYMRRSTLPGEVVNLTAGNTKRVYQHLAE